MLRQYFLLALRQFRRNLLYPAVSVFCLMIATALALITFVYVKDELQYDRFHKEVNQIYRVAEWDKGPQINGRQPVLRAPMGPVIQDAFPEVARYVRVSPSYEDIYISLGGKSTDLKKALFVDSSFFQLFSFRLLQGDPASCLINPHSIVLSQSLARRIFGDKDPVGQTFRSVKYDYYTVTGVAQDPPGNSHIQFTALMPISLLLTDSTIYKGWDGGLESYTYLQLREGTDPAQLEKKFVPFMWEHINHKYSSIGITENLYLQPLTNIHFYSDTDYDMSPKGNIASLWIMSFVALAVLILACINFFNLSTIQTVNLSKDAAIRKIAGALRGSLIVRFIVEGLLISFIGVNLGIALAELGMPLLSPFTGRTLSIHYTPTVILFCVGLVLFTGLLTGTAVAMHFARLNPAALMKKGFNSVSGASSFRAFLVVFQFVISIGLCICAGIMIRQVNFMLHKDLGFNRKNRVVIELSGQMWKQATWFKQEVLNVPGVRMASLATACPGSGLTANGYWPEGSTSVSIINVLGVDGDFLNTMDIPVIDGRNFSDNSQADQDRFLVNEAFVKQFGWKNPVGKTIKRNGLHEVIGVVRDFHFAPLYQKIDPLIVAPQVSSDAGSYKVLIVSFATADLQQSIRQIRTIWEQKALVPFNYHFLDDMFGELYGREMKQRDLMLVITFLALLIACLGLFSMTLYTFRQRTKEVGIRKVNGAGTLTIAAHLLKQVLWQVVIAFIIACPLAWIFMNKWQEQFAYKADHNGWIFILAGLISVAIAMITVLWQSLHTAHRNPVKALRYE